MLYQKLQFGDTFVEYGHVWCRITFPNGKTLTAMPEQTPSYYAVAQSCGYSDVNRSCIEHELVHVALAHWLGVSSYTLSRVLENNSIANDITRLEEQTVLNIQSLANALGINLTQHLTKEFK